MKRTPACAGCAARSRCTSWTFVVGNARAIGAAPMRPILGFALFTGILVACGGNNNTNSVCGDGQVTGSEQCDDGNTVSGDGCSSTCHTEAPVTCGNGVVEVDKGDQCDDGNTVDGDGCSSTCQNEIINKCGNGHLDSGETCDDGNTASSDGC